MGALGTIQALVRAVPLGSREIDARLCRYFFPSREIYVVTSDGSTLSTVGEIPIDGWEDYNSLAIQFGAEPLSTSTDHAIAIVMAALPGWRVTVTIPGHIDGVYQDGRAVASLESPLSSGGGPLYLSSQKTPALSVIDAMLQVIASMGGRV